MKKEVSERDDRIQGGKKSLDWSKAESRFRRLLRDYFGYVVRG